MKTLLFPIVILIISAKMSFPKRSLSICSKHKFSVLQLLQTEPPQRLSIQQERLEYDSSLVNEQMLLEDETELIHLDVPEFRVSHTQVMNKQAQNQYLESLTRLLLSVPVEWYENAIIILISVFLAIIFKLINQKRSQQQDEEVLLRIHLAQDPLIQDETQYSILNSKTISSLDQTTKEKYVVIEYQPQYKDPYEESFVKRSIRGTRTTRGSQCDESLLEIDELLQEMLRE